MSGVLSAVAVGYYVYDEAMDEQADIAREQNEQIGRQADALAQQAEQDRKYQEMVQRQTEYQNALARAENARHARIRRAELVADQATAANVSVAQGSQSSIIQGAMSGITAGEIRGAKQISQANIFGRSMSEVSQLSAYYGSQAQQYGYQAQIAGNRPNTWASAFQLYTSVAPTFF